MPLAPHTRLGPYEILGPLGAGGMGEVYRARDTRLERLVAIKALPDEFVRDPARLARFQREARLLASLTHPNIAAIHGLEEVDGAPYLVLEFVEGETLADRLSRGPLAVREVLEIGAEIAAALEAAHARGIVHRDLKPGNVMLTPAGQAKVLDFGLAKGSGDGPRPDLSASPTISAAMTAEGFVLGTAAYMSPEQARGQDVDARSDLWSFGCVLYECLTGRPPFAGGTVSDVIARILTAEPAWNALPAGTPSRLRDVLRQCLRKEAAERPRDAGELRRELTALAAATSPARSASGGAASRPAPSLAVLYFENLSSDPESDYFCAGITEDILTDLSKIKGMRVASRTAVARFRGTSTGALQVATELGVDAVLEGSVRRAGDRVRISAQLVSAADGFHLWAERYDRTLQDVFAVQEEIASSITAALRITLTPAETRELLRDRPDDARAYDLYLKGREFYNRYTGDSLRYALEVFEQATAIDPNYALAWAGIPDCYGQLVQWRGVEDADEALRLGLEAARRAQELDPGLPEGGKAEALIHYIAGRPDESHAALLRTLELHPTFIPAMINLGVNHMCRADIAAGERLMRRALSIDPHQTFAVDWLGTILLLTGRDDESLACVAPLLESDDPILLSYGRTHRDLVRVRRDDIAGVERSMRETLAAGGHRANVLALQAFVDARAGRRERAERALREVEEAREVGHVNCLVAADAALRLGEVDRAVGIVLRPSMRGVADVLVRLDPELHALLDVSPFAPRRSPLTLVWPAEAPPLDEARRAVFANVRIDSGLSSPSDAAPAR